jgi:hypothetical protein
VPRRPSLHPSQCSPAMQRAARELTELDVAFVIRTKHQLKVGNLNFYPGTGTIFRDEDSEALPEQGLEAFIELVHRDEQETKSEPTLRLTPIHPNRRT